MTARKFAISLPEELFKRLEQDRRERRMNRSEYVANAVADHLHRRREQELEEQCVPRSCVANADNVLTVPTPRLIRRVGPLAPEKLRALEDALRVALAL